MIEIAESQWHILSSLIIFIFGLLIANRLSKKFLITRKLGLTLYVWHTLFCIVYMIYTLSNPADSKRYFLSDNLDFGNFKFGSLAIELLTSSLKLFDLSYLGCFLVFNIFGAIGMIAFAGSLKAGTIRSNKYVKRLTLLILFLPSISFWSAGIGKDAISFMGVSFALWAALDFKQNRWLFLISILCLLYVRPHIAAIMVLAFSLSIIFDKKVNPKARITIFLIAIVASGIMVPFALKYAGVGDDITVNSVESFIEKREAANMGGGTSVDIASMSTPVKIFTYIFRPLPYEARSISSLISSLDNLILLLIFVFGAFLYKNSTIDSGIGNRKFLWFYSIGCLIVLSHTSANLGIAIRQKWMFLPILLFLVLSHIGQSKNSS